MYNLKIGVIESINDILANGTSKLDKLGLTEIQMSCWDVDACTPENAKVIQKLFGNRITISGLWAGWKIGPTEWNFTNGPLTIGLVPETWRKERMDGMKKVIDFANILHVKTVTTHLGFLPECPNTDEYKSLLEAIYEMCVYCNQYNIDFCFETGQETPIAIVRFINDVAERGLHNLKINLDPANLLLYGKANPSDAVDIFGQYVAGVHVKDGEYPTDGIHLGAEKKVGEGRVDFEYIIKKLHSFNYQGPLTIEREITGEKQQKDIADTIEFLKNILSKY